MEHKHKKSLLKITQPDQIDFPNLKKILFSQIFVRLTTFYYIRIHTKMDNAEMNTVSRYKAERYARGKRVKAENKKTARKAEVKKQKP